MPHFISRYVIERQSSFTFNLTPDLKFDSVFFLVFASFLLHLYVVFEKNLIHYSNNLQIIIFTPLSGEYILYVHCT